jgi:uncharacterized protein (TIRG00374 family)
LLVRPRLTTFIRLTIAVGLTAWIVWRSDFSTVAGALARASGRWILAACLLVVVDRLLMAYRWIALLAVLGDRRPPVAALVRIFFVSTYLGTFLVQTVGSDAARTWSLAREGVPTSASLASVLLDRLIGILSLLVSAGIALALVPGVVGQPGVMWPFLLTVAACTVSIAFVFSTRVDDVVRKILGRFAPSRVSVVLERLLDALQVYRRHRAMLAGVLIASLAVQGLRILQAWLLGVSLGMGASLSSYAAFIPLILLIMLLPITFNGLGTSQVAFVWAFHHVGTPDADALALSVLFVALGIVGNLPGGLLYALGRRQAVDSGAPTRPWG